MGYLDRITKAKKILASIPNKPTNSLELKYGNMNAAQAWEQFFSLFIIRFKHLYQVTADIDTKPIQWKTLSDIYNVLNDTVTKLAETALEFKFLMAKYGTDEYPECFKKHYDDINARITGMKTQAQTCKQLAIRHQITQHILYKKYEGYLKEILVLTPNKLFDDYFLQGEMPLDTFDAECVDKEGDPLDNLKSK